MKLNICIFWDSIAWWEFDSEKWGWADRIKLTFQKQMPERFIKVYNLWIPWKTTSDLVVRFEMECRARGCDIAIIAMWINDSGYVGDEKNHLTLEEQFRENLRQIFLISRDLHIKRLVFVGLTPVNEVFTAPLAEGDTGKSFKNVHVRQYDAYIQDFCRMHELEYISLDWLVELGELPDWLHLTSTGHAKIADVIYDRIVTKL